MTFTRAAAILGTALAVTAGEAAAARAQQPVAAFDELDTRIKVGDTVWVTDVQGRESKGKVRLLSAASLRLEADGVVETHGAARVRTIRTRSHDGLGNGVLWGALAGAAGGVLVAAGWSRECAGHDDCLTRGGAAVLLGLVGSAAGAGVGAVVDAAMPGPMLTIYEAPGGSSARVAIAPFVSARGRGLGVALRF